MANILADNLREIYPLPQRVRPLASTSITETAACALRLCLAELGYHDNRADAEWIENNLEAIARSADPVRDGVFRRAVPFAAAGAGGGRVREQRESSAARRSGPRLPAFSRACRTVRRCVSSIPMDDWSVVDYDGLLGWAKSEYLRPLP